MLCSYVKATLWLYHSSPSVTLNQYPLQYTRNMAVFRWILVKYWVVEIWPQGIVYVCNGYHPIQAAKPLARWEVYRQMFKICTHYLVPSKTYHNSEQLSRHWDDTLVVGTILTGSIQCPILTFAEARVRSIGNVWVRLLSTNRKHAPML